MPLSRVVQVELRKMFDTRSGFWLMASIVIAALLATVATIVFAPDDELTYYTFAKAIGFPMTVILPMIAILVDHRRVEPTHRPDHLHAGPAPGPGRPGQGIASVAVGVASMLFALAIGAVGNMVGTAIAGTAHGVGRVVRRGRRTSSSATCCAC